MALRSVRVLASAPPRGLLALAVFFALGAVIAALSGIALLTPGGALDPMWRLNPRAHAAFLQMGPWAVPLMGTVAAACGCSAAGLWVRARWGRRLAILLLAVNLIGDALNAVVRGDPRTLVGLPIGGLLIAYLLTPGVRAQFPKRVPAD